MNLNVDIYFLFICAVSGLLTLRENKERHIRVLVFFLLVELFVELLGSYYKVHHKSNTLLFTLYSVVEFSFYLYFFNTILSNPRFKQIIRIFRIVIPVICLLDIFLVQGYSKFNTYSFIFSSIVVDICAVAYFFQLFKNAAKLNLLKLPEFWIVSGVLFFYICSLSFLGIINYASSLPRLIAREMHNLFVLINILLYLMITIAFLCRLPIRKSISNSWHRY